MWITIIIFTDNQTPPMTTWGLADQMLFFSFRGAQSAMGQIFQFAFLGGVYFYHCGAAAHSVMSLQPHLKCQDWRAAQKATTKQVDSNLLYVAMLTKALSMEKSQGVNYIDIPLGLLLCRLMFLWESVFLKLQPTPSWMMHLAHPITRQQVSDGSRALQLSLRSG